VAPANGGSAVPIPTSAVLEKAREPHTTCAGSRTPNSDLNRERALIKPLSWRRRAGRRSLLRRATADDLADQISGVPLRCVSEVRVSRRHSGRRMTEYAADNWQ